MSTRKEINMKITISDKEYVSENITVNTTQTINVYGNADTDDIIRAIVRSVERQTKKATI